MPHVNDFISFAHTSRNELTQAVLTDRRTEAKHLIEEAKNLFGSVVDKALAAARMQSPFGCIDLGVMLPCAMNDGATRIYQAYPPLLESARIEASRFIDAARVRPLVNAADDAFGKFLTAIDKGDNRQLPLIEIQLQAILKKLKAEAVAIDAVATAPLNPERHSVDFCSVHWHGTDYTFTPMQAKIVGMLWAARGNGTPQIGAPTLLGSGGSSNDRLQDVFKSKGKSHPAWGTLIVQGNGKGAFMLQKPPQVAE